MAGKLFELLWLTIKRHEVFRAIIKNKANDDSHYWVRTTIMPVLSKEKDVTKYVGVLHRIEDEKLANEWKAKIQLD